MEEENITVTEAIELLFGSASLQQAIQAEDEADCDVSAGLDWDNQAFLAFIQNPALLGRLALLRVSLNCEIQRLLAERNLGVGENAAFEVARLRLLSRLRLPEPTVIPVLKTTLMRDDLYKEEFINDSQVLRNLLSKLLLESDWEDIATAAGNAVRDQVLLFIIA